MLARRIVDLIDTCTAGEFAFPVYARFIPMLRLLPSGMRTAALKASGMDRAAQDWVGGYWRGNADDE